MSRSGYSDEIDDQWLSIMWRGRVTSAMRGKRGQAFLRDLVEALDAMPEKRLIAEYLVVEEAPCDLVRWLFAAPEWHDTGYEYEPRPIQFPRDCGVCALGALGQKRGVSMARLDPEDAAGVGAAFDIAEALAREVVYENDEGFYCDEMPEHRWQRMRQWAASNLKERP